MNLSPIKKVLAEIIHWPNRKMFTVERVSSSGKSYNADISPEELEVVKILKNLEGVLDKLKIDEIRNVIEKYGQSEYSLGYDEAQRED